MKSNVVIRPSRYFDGEVKRLSKKYPSLKQDLANLNVTLLAQPRTGTDLGNGIYKIRLKITSKGRGKSAGGRVITQVKTEIVGMVENNKVNLITIYDKSEIGSISKQEIVSLIKKME